MSHMVERLDGYFIGTLLAKVFGLNRNYFNRLERRKNNTLSNGVVIRKIGGVIFVKLPDDVVAHMDIGYVSCKVSESDDQAIYDFVFALTRDTKIGFWK